jgi:hypothetical protein
MSALLRWALAAARLKQTLLRDAAGSVRTCHFAQNTGQFVARAMEG